VLFPILSSEKKGGTKEEEKRDHVLFRPSSRKEGGKEGKRPFNLGKRRREGENDFYFLKKKKKTPSRVG